jgi:hypothetical protein
MPKGNMPLLGKITPGYTRQSKRADGFGNSKGQQSSVCFSKTPKKSCQAESGSQKKIEAISKPPIRWLEVFEMAYSQLPLNNE